MKKILVGAAAFGCIRRHQWQAKRKSRFVSSRCCLRTVRSRAVMGNIRPCIVLPKHRDVRTLRDLSGLLDIGLDRNQR